MFNFLYSLLWGKEVALSLEESYKILESPVEEEKVIEPLKHEQFMYDDFTVLGKIGVITSIEKGILTIDDRYTFKSDSVYFRKGSKVSFNLLLESEGPKVINVTLIENDWTVEEDKTSKWCLRTLICQVEERNGRKLSMKQYDIVVDLDEVASDFVPKTGDWLQLDAKCEIDENVVDMTGKIYEVLKIAPIGLRTNECTVTSWNAKMNEGTLNHSIFFNGDSILGSYVPIKNDRVSAEIIESNQQRWVYRALQVLPTYVRSMKKVLGGVADIEDQLTVEGVILNDLRCCEFENLGETKQFEFSICNKKERKDLKVIDVTFPRHNSQCKVLTNCENIVIPFNGSFVVEYECTSLHMGKSKEYLIVSTDQGEVSRWVDVSVVASQHGHTTQNSRVYNKYYQRRDNSNIIRGESNFALPRFSARRLPKYPMANKYLDLLTNYKNEELLKNKLCMMKPCLEKELSSINYLDKFHTLLYIEELQDLLNMSIYDKESVVFVKSEDFLLWYIDNLSEKRPSLLMGDKVLVRDPHKCSDDTTWEGFIHQTGSKYVSIKFDKHFHQNYTGQEYSIQVQASRTTMKKLHLAVDEAVYNMGMVLLFPSKLELKKPQVLFEIAAEHFCENEEEKGHNVSNGRSISNQEADLDSKPSGSRVDTLKKIKEYNKKSLDEREQYKKQVLNQSSNDSSVSDEEPTPTRSRKEALRRIKEYNNKSPAEKDKYKEEILSKNCEEASAKKSLCETTSQDVKKSNSNHPIRKDGVFTLKWFNKELNVCQKEAVKNILSGEARPLPYVIYGPPGTGKTVTVVECILQILRLIPSSRILATAPSNSAADLLATRLINSKVLLPGDLVRFVAHKYINNLPIHLIPYSATGDLSKKGTNVQEPHKLLNGMLLGANSQTLGRNRLTVCTCSSAGTLFMMEFSKGHFSHIIVDEASQATEPEVLIPLSFLNPSSGQVILAGDPKQLGPVIMSSTAREYGLQTSYMDRILNRFPYTRDREGFPNTNGYDPRLITKLRYNYRSVPSLLKLTSSLFYDDDLIPVIPEGDEDGEGKFLMEKLTSVLSVNQETGKLSNIVFHGIVGENWQKPDSPSWYNPSEIGQIFYYVNNLYKAGIRVTDIGIISPYAQQVKEIRALLNEAEFEVPKIGSVEEFQGQEFNIVILSTVRSVEGYIPLDQKYSLGFISVPRRLNVALSRARLLLIIIGNPNLLQTDHYWMRVLNYIKENGTCLGCPIRS